MYQETKNINWASLFIKVIIFVLIGLLAIWLVSTVVKRIKNNSFEENINTLKDASIEYFKKGNLPGEEGESSEVTLGDLIKMKYITSFDKKCSREKSYSQATLVDDYYALRVELTCDSKKDYIYTSLEKDKVCPDGDCTAPSEDEVEVLDPEEFEELDDPGTGDNNSSEEPTGGNQSGGGSSTDGDQKPSGGSTGGSTGGNQKPSGGSSSGGSSTGGSTGGGSSSGGGSTGGSTGGGSSSGGGSTGGNANTNKTLYYEYVKVNKVYSNWSYTKPSGTEYETKQETVKYNKYCPVVKKDYYAIGSISDATSGAKYRFRIKLNDAPINSTNRGIVKNAFFNDNTSMYQSAVSNSQKVSFVEGSNALKFTQNATTLKNSSLKSSNLTLVRANIAESNGYLYNETTVQVNSFNNTSSYNNNYFIPMYFTVQYTDKTACKEDMATNASKYSGWEYVSSTNKNVSMYRTWSMQKDYNNTKWSTSKSLDGYVQTGNTQYR